MKIFILFILLYGCSLDSHSQVNDSLAYKIIKTKLEIIQDCINKKKVELIAVSNCISFLSELTGIGSESNGNAIGQMNPTENDYEKWKYWLERNKCCVFVDKKAKKIIFKKEIEILE